MPRPAQLDKWVLALFCMAVVAGGAVVIPASAAEPRSPSVQYIFQEPGGKSTQEGRVVINVLSNKFRELGHVVLDSEKVRRPTTWPTGDVEVGVGLRTEKRKVGGDEFEVHKVSLSAKVVLDCTGEVLTAANADGSKPFDSTGALERAAEALAEKLLPAIQSAAASRNRTDYRLVLFDFSPEQAKEVRAALISTQGVNQTEQCGQVGDASVLAVSVGRGQEVAFNRLVLTGSASGGLKDLDVAAREGNVIFFRRAAPAPTPKGKSTPLPPAPEAGYRPGYDNSWAVVVGINKYGQWPRLEHAVTDAENMRDSLQRLGFELVTAVLDESATKQNILNTVGELLRAKAKINDRVLVFFAGHGHTEIRKDGTRVGYIVPVDGKPSDPSSYISMEQLQALAEGIPVKHLFFVMDSCFSGGLVRFRGEIGPAPRFYPELAIRDILAKTRYPVRQVFTCGREGEQVMEKDGHGVCTNVILAGLGGEADLNGDGNILANELSRYAAIRVEEQSNGMQHPEFGYLVAKAPVLGDFVVKLAAAQKSN